MKLWSGSSTAAVLPGRLRRSLRDHIAPPALVLLYHRVVPQVRRDVNLLAVSTANFSAQLSWLAGHTETLGEAAFLNRLDRRWTQGVSLRRKRPSVLITFDDGYADNLTHALPIIQGYGLVATVFVTTGAVGAGWYWWDRLENIVSRGCPARGEFELPDGRTVPAGEDHAATYQTLHRLLKSQSHELQEASLEALAVQCGGEPGCVDDSIGRPMTWDELSAWHSGGMNVGGHTCTHSQLSALNDEELRHEISAPKRELESRLRTPIRSLSYPFGTRDDFDRRAEAAARAAGYRCAFANWEGNARWARSRYALPRHLVRDWPLEEFVARFERWLP